MLSTMPDASKVKTKLAPKQTLWLIAGLLLIIGTAIVLSSKDQNLTSTVEIGSARYTVEIADEVAEQQQGLSGREGLAESAGMLFIYEQPGLYGYWMNEMLFSIDILFLDQDKRVVHIVEGASPESYPEVFRPPEPAQYVLEVSSGEAARYGMSVGDTASITVRN